MIPDFPYVSETLKSACTKTAPNNHCTNAKIDEKPARLVYCINPSARISEAKICNKSDTIDRLNHVLKYAPPNPDASPI